MSPSTISSPSSALSPPLLSSAPAPWAMRSLLYFPFPMRLHDEMHESSPELGCLA